MRRKQCKKSAMILGPLALVVFVLAFFPAQSWAPAPVADNDGFPDADELAGITLPAGMTLAATPTGVNNLPNCSDPGGLPRDQCMDEGTPDLFVIISRALEVPSSTPCGVSVAPLFDNFIIERDAAGNIIKATPGQDNIPESNIPFPTVNHYDIYFDPLALVESGLDIAVHEIFQAPGSTGQAIAGHYAVRIVENLDPCGVDHGYAVYSTPYQYSTAVVWTERIKNWINQTCSQACFDFDDNGTYDPGECFTPATSGMESFKCKNAVSGTEIDMLTSQSILPLYYDFIQNIINHEDGHLIYLASGRDTFDHHYPIAEGVVMEQFMDVKQTINKQRNKVTVILYISTQFARASQGNFALE